ncbi:hypothetical protein EVG20_g10313 [Dentipellis fragilis]|uniref:Uncharacterized protein n=1 Tax=Dentipellis fragilis TaxID=205917 RepID=A0A4Y9XV15_9AGAM|nr:hypothetical protein EVG20_g10313 [Dentipellis fragilis]
MFPIPDAAPRYTLQPWLRVPEYGRHRARPRPLPNNASARVRLFALLLLQLRLPADRLLYMMAAQMRYGGAPPEARLLVGISGIPASGKSTLAELVVAHTNAALAERSPSSPIALRTLHTTDQPDTHAVAPIPTRMRSSSDSTGGTS